MTQALAKKQAAEQQLAQHQQQQQYARDVETREHSARADASAGLNLNLFGALSGAFSSKSKKTTHSKPDGSSMSVEERDEGGAAQGYAQGHGTAYAQGTSSEDAKHEKSREIGQGGAQSKKQVQKVDHLGIEGL